MRAEDMTPDISWGSVAIARRRPRTSLGRAVRSAWRLANKWWVWTTYIGMILGFALFGSCAPPATADEQVITFSAPAVKYVTEHGVEVCATLDTSTPAQVGELLHKMHWLGGLTEQQASEALYFSVVSICPIHLALLDAYIDTTYQVQAV
ncbi:MAG: hypothetical protein K2Y33_04670 [Mycolicibacterium frederiksbergense]|nr:hypothetical protein [Mycolicibacterium frederiksbergense]